MAKTQEQLNAAILANRQKNAPMIAERAARAKETGQDLNTVGKQMRQEAHEASLRRLYGDKLDVSNPDAVNAARAAKQAAASQSRMDARQIRDADFAAKQAAAVKQTAIDDDAYNQRARQVGLDRAAARGQADAARRAQAQTDTIARMEAAKAASRIAPPTPQTPPPPTPEPPPPTPEPPKPEPQRPISPPPERPPLPTPQVLPQQNNPTGPGMKRGGRVKKMASGGMTSKVSSASRRGDGIATKGKTKGRFV